jgi:hypothetical protein
MKPKLLLCLAIFLFKGMAVAHADMCVYESVEWLVARAEQIGVYRAEQIYGPHSVTNSPISISCCFFTADFKLETTLRGNPPPAFSRSRSVEQPEQLGFHVGNTYVFFFVPGEQPEDARGLAKPGVDDCFAMWDYLWLERPPAERNGAAIDHRGKVLTEREDVLKLIDDSLKLPRAGTNVLRWDYYYSDATNRVKHGFQVIDLPTEATSQGRDAWAAVPKDYEGLVIPQGLAGEEPATTNRAAGQ